MASAGFLMVTFITLRAVHHWGGVEWGTDMLSTSLAQTSLTVVWSVLGVLGWVIGSRRGHRGLWLAGAVLPSFTSSPVLLSLHLLRAGVGVHLFGALAMAALTVRWSQSAGESDRRIRAPLMALSMATTRYLLPLIILIVPLTHRRHLPPRLSRLRLDLAAAALLVFAIWPVQIAKQAAFNAKVEGNIASWRALGLWAKAHSAPDAMFLIPIGNIRLPPPYPAKDRSQERLSNGYEVFQTFAERKIWTDVRGGGAIMWTPSYHHVWYPRVIEVMALPDHAARMAYAQAHHIDFVIDGCGDGRLLVNIGRRCVYAVARTSSARLPPLLNRSGS